MQLNEDKPYDDINITPMLDLAYVLLVIFILMCTAAVQGLKADLPAGTVATKSLADRRVKAITVNLEGKVFLDTQPVTLSELEGRLAQMRARNPDMSILLRGDRVTNYQAIMDVLNVVGGQGITQVGLATKPGPR
jgi:biopolymer transport protein ExbD